jgi:hypothetical protein
MTKNPLRSRTGRAAIGVAAGVPLLLCCAFSCGNSSNGNAAESSAQGTDTSLQEQNQPLPIFPTSAYRQELIEIEAIEALGSPTTTFFFPPNSVVVTSSGTKFLAPPIKMCSSQGEPVPNTASLSNPLQVVTQDSSGNGIQGSAVVGQMDPNGGYVPNSSTGTDVLCDAANGGSRLAYWEGDVYAESGTAVWSDTEGIVDVGPSALPVCVIRVAVGGDGSGVKAGTRYYHCTDSTGKSVNSSGA